MRTNHQIRSQSVRVIDEKGEQVGIISTREALRLAEEAKLDLVEIVPTANPPVCKIIDYGKYRYDQTKREKEKKKAQQQLKVKIKEIKFKPNIDEHDFQTKVRQARDFIEKGNKVKLTCTFRGREMIRPELGTNLLQKVCDELSDVATQEAPLKRMGRMLNTILAPGARKKKEFEQHLPLEDVQEEKNED